MRRCGVAESPSCGVAELRSCIFSEQPTVNSAFNADFFCRGAESLSCRLKCIRRTAAFYHRVTELQSRLYSETVNSVQRTVNSELPSFAEVWVAFTELLVFYLTFYFLVLILIFLPLKIY